MAVRRAPGTTELTRMPRSASSKAAVRVSPRMPHLEVE